MSCAGPETRFYFSLTWGIDGAGIVLFGEFEHERESVRRGLAGFNLVATHLGTGLFLLHFFFWLARETGSMDFTVWAAKGVQAHELAGILLFYCELSGSAPRPGSGAVSRVVAGSASRAAKPRVALMSGVSDQNGNLRITARAFTFLGAPPLCGDGSHSDRSDFGCASAYCLRWRNMT